MRQKTKDININTGRETDIIYCGLCCLHINYIIQLYDISGGGERCGGVTVVLVRMRSTGCILDDTIYRLCLFIDYVVRDRRIYYCGYDLDYIVEY